MEPADVDAEALDSGSGPFGEPSFRADLALLAESARGASRRWAADAVLIASLADRVPRESGDERGGSAWTSFLREIAVARRTSDVTAVSDVFTARRLVQCHPCSLELLRSGAMTVGQARKLLEVTANCEPETAREVDAAVAERACQLPAWRVKQEATKVLLQLDADAAAARAAAAARSRSVRKSALEDGQAEVVLTGPALPVTAWYERLTADARAARAAGDPRGLDVLRFDLAVGAPPPADASHTTPAPSSDITAEPTSNTSAGSPADATADTEAAIPADTGGSAAGDADAAASAAGTGSLPAWLGDRRRTRPVQALIQVPVTTALGLSNEPGWLDGYGWISAPQCRALLTTAELRKVCVTATGQVIDSAERVVRPDPIPRAVRDALLGMVTEPFEPTAKTSRIEPQHDPTPALAGFVMLRDRYCDGPTGTQVPAVRCDLDHNDAYPGGPTAAWNLPARSRRTHALKHYGWTPRRTPHSTLWFSPAGQLVETSRFLDPPPVLDPDAELPDPDELHAVDAELTREPTRDDDPPMPPPF